MRTLEERAAVTRAANQRNPGVEANPKYAHLSAVAARPLAELLDCPPGPSSLLTSAAQSLSFAAGDRVFCQGDSARGLYVVVTGEFLRKAERFHTRVTLGFARPGDLIELAAALGGQLHTYTLTALTAGTLLLLPQGALEEAFNQHPPLRMKLLEELAREVSRAYLTSSLSRVMPARRNSHHEAHP